MPFQKGQSGNPAGRPKKEKTNSALIKEAWEELTSRKPWIIREALERGLTGSRPLGFLELGARVMKEIGQQEEKAGNVTIVVNSPLNMKSLKPLANLIPLPQPQAHPELPAANVTEAEVIDLLEDEDATEARA